MGLELHIYDFDGTLFRSPEKPEGWDNRWWISSESLNPPCVPLDPSGEWWISKTVSAARASIANPDTYAVMMTGRPVRSGFRYRVPELLKSVGLKFDEVYLSDTNNTPAFKIKVIKDLLRRFPGVEKIVFWDDNAPYLARYIKLVEGYGYQAEANLVTVPAMGCGEVPAMGEGPFRKEASEQIEVMKFLSAVARNAGIAEHVYVVGGAVRNFIIGQPIKDVDVVIDSVALRGRDSAWFARKIADSLPCESSLVTNNYGVAILTIKGPWILNGHDLSGEVIEIANARKESYGGEAGKGYKPNMVEPATIQEDVVRREFTFNSLLWRLHDLADGPDKAEIIDLSGCGLKDLQSGTMRCPNDPDIIFSDDPSRMIRAIKFLLKYGFRIDPEVAASIKRNAGKLKKMPAAHLSTMLVETFFEPGVGKKALLEMDKLGLLDVVREIAQENKPFRAALDNWANKRSGLEFLFDLLDLQMPMGKRLSVVPQDLLPQFRAYSEAEPDKAVALLEVLDQPGRKFDMPRLIRELGISGAEIKDVTNTIRRLLVLDPDLTEADLYRKLIQGRAIRTAAAPDKYSHIDFKPPKSVADAAEKGLEYREKASPSNKGGLTPAEASKLGIGSGVQRAVNLKNRDNISPDVIRQMTAFFSRHEKNKSIAPENKDTPWNDKGHVAWLIWGGDPGKAWAEKVRDQMDKADERVPTKTAAKITPEKLKELMLKVRKGATGSIKLPQIWAMLEAIGGKMDPTVGLVPQFTKDAKGIVHAGDKGEIEAKRRFQETLLVSRLPSNPKTGVVYVTKISPIIEISKYGGYYFEVESYVGKNGFRVQTPDGKKTDFLPGRFSDSVYEHDVLDWLKNNTDWIARINHFLGTDEHVPAAERTREGTGTCPVCFRNVKISGSGSIMLHGYKRPGYGMTEGKCPGVGYPPFELSVKGVAAYLNQLVRMIAEEEAMLAKLRSGDVTELFVFRNNRRERVTPEHRSWQFFLQTEIKNLEGNLPMVKKEKEEFTLLKTHWVERPLPKEGDRERNLYLEGQKPSARRVARRFVRLASDVAEPPQILRAPHPATLVLRGVADLNQIAPMINRVLPRISLEPASIPKPKTAGKAYNFHWSNAQAAWDVIPVRDYPTTTDGSEFVLFIPKGVHNPVYEGPWTLRDMQVVARNLNPHPAYSYSMESSRGRF